MRRPLSPVLILFVPFASMGGQQLSELAPGARVRLRAPGVVAGRHTGTLLARTPDTLVVGRSAERSVRVRVSALTSLEVRRRMSRGRGALVQGAAGGAGLGLFFGVFSDDRPGQSPAEGRLEAITAGALMGGLLGAAVGAIRPPARWQRYELHARTSLLAPPPWALNRGSRHSPGRNGHSARRGSLPRRSPAVEPDASGMALDCAGRSSVQ